MPFSLLGGCQVRAARPLAPLPGGVCLPPPGGVTAPGTPSGHSAAGTSRKSTRGHAGGHGGIGKTSKIPRLHTLKNLGTWQSVNCAAVYTHYLIFLPPAARLRSDFNPELHFSVGFLLLLLLLLVWCFLVLVWGFLCVVLGFFSNLCNLRFSRFPLFLCLQILPRQGWWLSVSL